MTREQISKIALEESKTNKCIILELATGVGKTAISINIVNNMKTSLRPKVLILVAQSVHKKNWKEELEKWHSEFTPIIECYPSLKKYSGQEFDFILLDEGQHLSELRREIFNTITVKQNIVVLSATLPREVRDYFRYRYKTRIIKVSTAEAIDSNILPDPVIYKIPLYFNNVCDEEIIVNPAKEGEIKPKIKVKYTWNNYWNYKSNKKVECHLMCTAKERDFHYARLFDLHKRRNREINKLRVANERLQWLAQKKNDIVKTILLSLQDQRTITFCTNIAQTETVGSNCIHSKNKGKKANQAILNSFNEQKINHVTTCHILDEGVNLVNCRVGVLANINASKTITIQRIGRCLRHKEPVIIMPYYVGTREEELVNQHLEGYNPKLIKTITNYKQIKL